MLQTKITQDNTEAHVENTDGVNSWPLTLNDSLATNQPEHKSRHYLTRVRHSPLIDTHQAIIKKGGNCDIFEIRI